MLPEPTAVTGIVERLRLKMAIILDDIDDDDVNEPGVDSLSTDELRREVARLQSMLGESGDEDAEDEEEEEEEEDAASGAVEHPSAFDLPSFVDEVKLDYTNGDVYKVRYTFSDCVGEFVSLPQQEGFGSSYVNDFRTTNLTSPDKAGRSCRENQKWQGHSSMFQRRYL